MKRLLYIFVAFFFFSPVTHANIARDSSLGDQSENGAGSLTYSFTNTAGNLLVVTCQGNLTNNVSNITGATYNGVSMTKIGGYDGSGSSGYNRWTYEFYLLAPATGAHNIVVSDSPQNSFIDCNTESYSGVKQTGNPVDTNTGVYAGTNASITLSPTVSSGRWGMFSIVSRDSQDASCFASASASLAAGDYVTNPNASMFGTFDSNGPAGASYTFGYSGCTQSATDGIMTTWDPISFTPSTSSFNFWEFWDF